MNVNNRKMFKPRPARNKLNSMGGIMSSSPELIDTVARFQQGGSIYANQPSMITSIRDFLNTGDAQSGVGQIQEQNAMIRAGITPEDLQRVRAATAANQVADSVQAAQATPIPVGDLTSNISNISSQLSDIGALMSPQQVAGSEARRSQLQEAESRQLLDGIFASPLQAPGADVFAMPGVTPSPEPALAPEQPAVVEPAPAPQVPAAAQQEDLPDESPEVMAAAKRGELGPEAQVKAVVQQGTPEEQQQELSRLMAEFTQNAPEFGGADRGLAMAKIGFAMAAGQSPNAITNIANALNEGADALIKDKRERDAFNRQVQLSALQYGLGEIGKQRAQDRLDERTFREFVAGKDGIEYNGQTYNEGETILVSQAEILANDGKIPDGLQDKTVFAAGVKAAQERLKSVSDTVRKLEEERVLSDSTADKVTTEYKTAVNTFQSGEVGVQLLENAILDVAEGNVTGFANGFESAMNKVANAAGIKLDERFQSVDEFRSALRRAFQKLIPTTLGEAQSANSISDRDVTFLADAFINAGALENGVFSLAFVDDDVLIGQLQGAIGEFRRSQRSALDTMTGIESRLSNRTLPGTREAAGTLLDPFRQSMQPYMPQQTQTQAGLVRGEDGVFRLQ